MFSDVVAPLKPVGDIAFVELEESFLRAPGMLGLEEEADRCAFCVGEVVFAIEPLVKKDPGRSPNLGKANEKSPPFPLLL